MDIPAPRDDAVAREWQTLSRKLSHARGFCFIVYFVRDQRQAAALKQRLRDGLRGQGGVLVDIAVDTPGDLVEGSTAPLFRQAPSASTSPSAFASASASASEPESESESESESTSASGAAQRVFWLEAFRGAGMPEWTAPREQLLMRLNERRSRLEAELRAPLVLLLPAGTQRLAATLAPDLWHIRIHSAALEATTATGPGQQDDGRATKGAPLVVADATADEPREVAWWRAQRALAAQQAARQTAQAPESPEAPGFPETPETHEALEALEAHDAQAAPVALWDGFSAVMASIGSGRFAQAQALVDELIPIATAQWQASTGDQRANATRQLAQAHAMAGVLANVQGRFGAALPALETAVQHLRVAVAAEGASTLNLSMLAAQLNQLGIALKGLDRLDAAGLAFDEALAHARWLARQPDAGTDAPGTLAMALGNVGDVQRLRGDWGRAEAAFSESLALIRASLAPDAAPASRRTLGVALFKLALVAQHQGRLDEAASAFAEALAIDRSRLAQDGRDLQALDDVAVDLEALANLDGAPQGSRLAAAAEALQLRQRQVELRPDAQAFQHALARVSQTFDNLQLSDSSQPPP